MDENETYKEMYLHLMRETEKAVRILIAAQQECEERCLNAAPAEAQPEDEE